MFRKKTNDSSITKVEVNNPIELYSFPRVFVTYINTGYYLGLIPFRIKSCKSPDIFSAEKSIFQKVVCISLQIWTLIVVILQASQCFRLDLRKNPSASFSVATSIISNCQLLIYFNFCWIQSSRIVDVINMVSTHDGVSSYNRYRKVVLLTYLWMFVEFTISAMGLLSIHGFIAFPSTCRKFLGVLMHATYQADTPDSYSGELSLDKITLASFFYIGYCLLSCFKAFIFLLTSFSIFAILEIVMRLMNTLDGDDSILHRQVVGNLLVAKHRVTKINIATGNILLVNFPAMFCVQSISLIVLFHPNANFVIKIYCVLSTLKCNIVLWNAAKSQQMVQNFKEIVMEKLTNIINSGHLSLEERSCYEWLCLYLNTPFFNFGVNASHFFTITYSLLGMTLSVLLTYYFVLLQLNPTIETN